jgi:DNA-binding MarR family transcriptional regulator
VAKANDEAPLGDVLEFMRLIWALDNGLASASKRMGQRLGVTGPQRLALRVLGKQPGSTAGELAQVLHVHPSTLTGILQRLEERGFVVRHPDPVDRRKTRLALTEKGRAMNGERQGTVEAAVRRALRKASPREIAATGALLKSLAHELQLPAPVPKGPRS